MHQSSSGHHIELHEAGVSCFFVIYVQAGQKCKIKVTLKMRLSSQVEYIILSPSTG